MNTRKRHPHCLDSLFNTALNKQKNRRKCDILTQNFQNPSLPTEMHSNLGPWQPRSRCLLFCFNAELDLWK
jgi:hypothetical protein